MQWLCIVIQKCLPHVNVVRLRIKEFQMIPFSFKYPRVSLSFTRLQRMSFAFQSKDCQWTPTGSLLAFQFRWNPKGIPGHCKGFHLISIVKGFRMNYKRVQSIFNELKLHMFFNAFHRGFHCNSKNQRGMNFIRCWTNFI